MITRLFCVTVYVFNETGDACLFINHRKLQRWIAPGGKIDAHELPDDAAVRECFEETGVVVKLFGEVPSIEGALVRPYGMQLNVVIPNEREHIDFIYGAFADQKNLPVLNLAETSGVRWIPVEEILDPSFNTFTSVKEWVKRLSKEIKEKKFYNC